MMHRKMFTTHKNEDVNSEIEQDIRKFDEETCEAPCEKNCNKKNLKLAPPWVEYFRKIEALFGQDPDIHIGVSDNTQDGDPFITLRIDNQEKYEAISAILPAYRMFGNVQTHVRVIPANESQAPDRRKIFETAFKGNPALKDFIYANTPFAGDVAYIVFDKKVVQYPNDEMQDPNGLKSTLYQDIARDIFDNEIGMFFCTATD